MIKIKKEEENKKTHKRKGFHTCACHLYISTVLYVIIPCLILNRVYDQIPKQPIIVKVCVSGEDLLSTFPVSRKYVYP